MNMKIVSAIFEQQSLNIVAAFFPTDFGAKKGRNMWE